MTNHIGRAPKNLAHCAKTVTREEKCIHYHFWTHKHDINSDQIVENTSSPYYTVLKMPKFSERYQRYIAGALHCKKLEVIDHG
jgi:hypothetical protein